MTYTIQELREKNLIIFETVAGSHAYGTSTPESDRDIRGVFVQPLSDALKYGFVEQVSDETNDVTFYELGRFVDLVIGNNPNILEMLAMPKDCEIYCHPVFKMLINNVDKFLTKRVRWTFAGYAIDQIKKARGYNKKMNWEEEEMVRKTVLDFCYVIIKGRSKAFKEWLATPDWDGYTQEDFGLALVDHAHNLYAMYENLHMDYQWGLVSDEEKANEVQLTSIPKNSTFVANVYFNADAYSTHCKKYLEFQTWLKERNPNRFKMNKEHGKNYDSKNMMHTYRLLLMAHELAKGELRVRRTDEERVKLMKIRHGEYEYADLLTEAEAMIAGLDEAFEVSTLPKDVDKEYAHNLLGTMRNLLYFNHE